MESPEEIEKALSRLMPAALSEGGRRTLDELIDGLAAGDVPVAPLPRPAGFPWGWVGGLGAAAAAVVLALSFPAATPGVPVTIAPSVPSAAAGGIVRIGQSERVETAVPEDWMSESDGVAHRAWRVRVVDEERLHDVATGYEVLVSRPREQVVLMPVTAF
jgi:hypothetical protein